MRAMNVSSLPRKALIPELLNLLKEGLPEERVDCARLLGRWKHHEAKEALQEYLGDPEEEVCVAAAEAMGSFADPSVIELLGQMAREHPDGEARIAAVRALARIDAPEAHAALLTLINLAEASEGMEEGWNHAWDVQREAISLVDGSLAHKAVPTLMDLLIEQEADDLEPEILEALARSGSAAENAFWQLLSHPLPRLRRRAARAIKKWQNKSAPVILFRFLRDQHPQVRIEALSSLAFRTETAYFRDILLCLEDRDTGVRSAAISAIQTITDKLGKQALDEIGSDRLKKLFTDDDPRIRCLGWHLLARQDEAIEEDMALWLEQHVENLHSDEIVTALGAIPQLAVSRQWHRRVFEMLWLRWGRESAELATAMARQWQCLPLDETDGDKFLELLAAEQACVRLAAINSLVQCTTGQQKALAVHWLGDILHGEPDLLSQPSNSKTEQADDDRLIPLRDEDATSADDESSLIQHIMDREYPEHDDGHSEPLMHASEAPRSTLDAVARANIDENLATAIQENDQDSELENMLTDLPGEMSAFSQVVREHVEAGDRLCLTGRKKADFPDASNAILVIRALGGSDSGFAVRWLREHLLTSDIGVQAEAVSSLGRIAQRRPDLGELSSCLGPLATLLTAAPPAVRAACANTLGSLGHPTALPLLLAALEDTHAPVRVAAISAVASCLSTQQAEFEQRHDVVLENLESRQVFDSLHQALKDPEPEVRAAALRVLVEKRGESIRQLLIDTALNDPDLTESASRLLARMEPETTVEKLAPIVKESNRVRRSVALRLLLEITKRESHPEAIW
jgi:HEAT repeat protein